MKTKELRIILESLDSGTAHWAYGYLKGYFSIKDASIETCTKKEE